MSLPSENVLVDRLRAIFGTRRRDVVLGIGDDSAIVRTGPETLLTTDVLVEGADFTAATDPRSVGWKALSVNVSDLAAMGATPVHALLTLGLPRDADPVWLEAVAQGVRAAAREYGVAVVGGDLSASATAFVSLTLLGRPPKGRVLRRDGARPGDALFVSGTLGAAAAGLALLEHGYRVGEGKRAVRPSGRRVPDPLGTELARLMRHQLSPRPALELGRTLAEQALATAALDVSDGLGRDLHRLCRASGVGAVVERDSIPVDSTIRALGRTLDFDPLAAALFGGEDFGLLFTVPPGNLPAVERLASRFALRRIGTIQKGSELVLASPGGPSPLPDAGFDHFGQGPKTSRRRPREG